MGAGKRPVSWRETPESALVTDLSGSGLAKGNLQRAGGAAYSILCVFFHDALYKKAYYAVAG